MLSIGAKPLRLCDRVGRRDFLQVGALGAFGLGLQNLLQAQSRTSASGSFGRANRCILLFMHGGPPQHDTWDPKPDAPLEIRGELKPIQTAAPGVWFSELFPKVAAIADKLTVVRSVTHSDTVHTSAGYTMLTGAYHARPNQAPTALPGPEPNDHPHPGSIVSLVRGARSGLPPFVAVPEVIKDAGVNTYPGQGPGFLGKSHSPLLVEASDDKRRIKPPTILLPSDLSAERLQQRRGLLNDVNGVVDRVERSTALRNFDAFQAAAWEMVSSPQARQAFALDREPAATRERYGEHLFGQGCLLARRLAEAGVSLVSVYWHYEGPEDSPAWDTHANNFPHLRKRLAPPTDQALSALVEDLHQRGMLNDTLLVCLGEFGRSPKINNLGGREHWPQVQSILLAGAGLPGGQVFGSSDKTGGLPDRSPVSPPELNATLLHLLGVPADLEFHNLEGRPIRAYQAAPVAGLVV